MVHGLGNRVQGSEFGVCAQGSEFRVQGAGCRVQGSGFRIDRSRLRALKVPSAAFKKHSPGTILSHIMYLSVSSRKSTPPKNRRLIVSYY